MDAGLFEDALDLALQSASADAENRYHLPDGFSIEHEKCNTGLGGHQAVKHLQQLMLQMDLG